MIAGDLIQFETRRAIHSAVSPSGLFAILFGSAFLSLLALYGVGAYLAASSFALLFLLGAAWSSLAAVYAVDRNKNSAVEDVWFAFEPRRRRQLTTLYFAWLPIAFSQAALTSIIVVLVRPGSSLSDLLGLLLGFLAAVPLGLLLSALARLVPGFSLLAGVVFVAVILCAQALSALAPGVLAHRLTTIILFYAVAALLGFALLTSATGRSR
jgi:hypothetical protein